MLTEQARLRFGIALWALDVESAAHRLPVICHGAVDAEPALNLFHGFANRLELLTPELIQQSDVRLEEFSRHFCSLWGLTILNENAAVRRKDP